MRAEICRMPGVSGHADNQGLIRWISSLKEKPKMVFVTHGEDQVCDLFKKPADPGTGTCGQRPLLRVGV